MSAETTKGPDYDPLESQTCYLFNPGHIDGTASRPTKKRRTAKPKPPAPLKPQNRCLFSSLWNSQEPEAAVQLRWDTYHRLWEAQEIRTTAILDSFNQKTLDDISAFVASAKTSKYSGKLPTGLVLAGPNIASHGRLFEQFRTRLRDVDDFGPVVILTSKDASNLKGTLKKLIRDATEQADGVDEDDEEIIIGRKGAKLLNYDLQILVNWCTVHEGKKIIIAVQDTEAFDSVILADLVSLFSAHQDRIPFILLLGIATSLEIFHEKLPKAVIRLMEGEKFDVERADECLSLVFNDAVLGDKSVLRIGPTLCDFLMDRQRDHTQSIQTFVAGLKYMYMTHFYANPLSIILASVDGSGTRLKDVLSDRHCQAVRNLPSFKRMIETAIASKDTKMARELLDNNTALVAQIEDAAKACREYGIHVSCTLKAFEVARNSVASPGTRVTQSELYSRVLAGDLNAQSPAVRELLLLIKKSNSGASLKLLESILSCGCIESPEVQEQLQSFRDQIKSLTIDSEGNRKKNLTSEFDITNNALRTTAVSRRIQISEHKSGLSSKDSEYSKLIQQVHDVFEGMFSRTFTPVHELFLHEIFFYDYISPHKDVLSPRQRATVEDALSKPSEYLSCECCYVDDEIQVNVMKNSNPPTSIGYQLFLESGALINAYDLYRAFQTILEGESEEDGVPSHKIDEKAVQALYFHTVAELKFMGFVKSTRKRVDHLQKLAWKGL